MDRAKRVLLSIRSLMRGTRIISGLDRRKSFQTEIIIKGIKAKRGLKASGRRAGKFPLNHSITKKR
jgi:hypothetical protein